MQNVMQKVIQKGSEPPPNKTGKMEDFLGCHSFVPSQNSSGNTLHVVALSVWRREPQTFWRYGEWSTCFLHPFLFIFLASLMRNMCIGFAK